MTVRGDSPIPWLRAALLAALGLSPSACVDRTTEPDLGGETGDDGEESAGEDSAESGSADMGAGQTEPFDCPDAKIVVETELQPDGTCAACGEACLERAIDAVSGPCGFDCMCDSFEVICTSTFPDEAGRCQHGATYYRWCL